MLVGRPQRFHKAVLILIGWLIFLVPDPACAFIFIRGGSYSTNQGERPVANAPIWNTKTFYLLINLNQRIYNGSLSPELDEGEFEYAVREAAKVWEQACNAEIEVVVAGTTPISKDANNQINVVSWDNRTSAEGNVLANTGTLAAAYVAQVGDHMYDCDIIVNGEAIGSFGVHQESSKYDLVSVLAHEIGHCLGLDHAVQPPNWTSTNDILNNTVMYSSISTGRIRRILSQDEKDAMNCVYGRGYPFRQGEGCSSYHGTSGGGALSGTVTGGPSVTQISLCGSAEDAVNIQSSDEIGNGCITTAFANHKYLKTHHTNHYSGFWGVLYKVIRSWLLAPLLLFLGYLLIRRRELSKT